MTSRDDIDPAVGTPPRRPLVDRMFDWLLDRRGAIYGDERERVLWYEGIDIAASVQWILVPWTLAVAAWIAPPEAAPYLWAVFAAFLLPISLMGVYVARRRVRMDTPAMRDPKAVLLSLLFWLPVLSFVVGMTYGLASRTGDGVARDPLDGAVDGALIGGAAGLAVYYVVTFVRGRRRSGQALGDDDQ